MLLCQHSRSSLGALYLGDLYSVVGIPSQTSLEGLIGVLAQVTMSSLAQDLLYSYRFILENLGIPISDVQHCVDGGIGTHPQPHSSHQLGSGHGGSTHHDPPTNHWLSAEGHICEASPRTVIA